QGHLAIEMSPKSPSGYNNLAVVFQAKGKLEEAEVNLRKALQLNPGVAHGHYNLACILLEQERYQQAELEMRMPMALEPGRWDASKGLARVREAYDRHEECLPVWREFVRLHPGATAYVGLGKCLLKLGQHQQAEKAFCDALEQNGKHGEAL